MTRLTCKPWNMKQALYRAKRQSIKDDETQIVIIDLDYDDDVNRPRYFDFCTWRDYQNQWMREETVILEIEDGKISETYRPVS